MGSTGTDDPGSRVARPWEALEETPCPVCGVGREGARIFRRFPPFQLWACGNCGVWYLSPRLKSGVMLAEYRDGRYFSGAPGAGYVGAAGGYQAQEEPLRRTFRAFLGALEKRRLAGGSLLEIGCAYGYFLDEAREHFQRLVGTDFSEDAVARTRSLGLECIHGGLDHLAETDRFDRILSIGVLEHIYRPGEWVSQAVRHLNPGGWLIHATPFAGSLWFWLMGRRWPSYKVPEHVALYGRLALRNLMVRCGARELIWLPYVHYFSLGLVAAKLGLPVAPDKSRGMVPLPQTMLAVAARFS